MFWNIGGNSITLQSFEAEVQRKCEVSKGKSTARICPNGGIGRRVGLKIQCPLKTCRFEPGFGHPTEVSLVFWGDFFFFCQIQPYVFCPVPSGGGNARRCRSSVPCYTLGRRRCTKVLPKGAVLHPRATISVVFVAEGFPSSILHSALRPWAMERREESPDCASRHLRVRDSQASSFPESSAPPPAPVVGEVQGGAVAWSCGHYIGHYIRHIRLIFGNFYYFCPDTCHGVTSRAGDARQERDTDRKGDRWSPSYLPKHR